MDQAAVEKLFRRSTGDYVFARWGRPIVPVVFGVEQQTLDVVKAAFEAVVVLAGHKMAETDPELGANLMVFFIRDWDELGQVPRLGDMIPDMEPMLVRLKAEDANQYRVFRFEESGAIKAAFVFIRMDQHLEAVSADTLALSQAVQTILLWSDEAFTDASPLAVMDGTTILRPDVADVVRAAYDPVMPVAAQDSSHALRMAARLGRGVQ